MDGNFLNPFKIQIEYFNSNKPCVRRQPCPDKSIARGIWNLYEIIIFILFWSSSFKLCRNDAITQRTV